MSEPKQPLILIGASARAAAFSALRAGLGPWCADLFADLDLQARAAVRRVAAGYPHAFLDILDTDIPGPWMYTGGLENWPELIEVMANRRPLWGNSAAAVESARDPIRIARLLKAAGLPVPETLVVTPDDFSRPWLIKLRCGSGGRGVRHWKHGYADQSGTTETHWQEYVDGQPAAAIYAADRRETRFLGLSHQLVGADWLGAKEFQYCGSIGPVAPPPAMRRELTALGELLRKHCGLIGLFGVDGVIQEDAFWPVEVNPRYTASVEVLEYATGLRALAWHRRAFDADAPEPSPHPVTPGFVGKAILFAQDELTFPADGPWLSELRSPTPLDIAPDFADIPAAGEVIPRGRPILTFFVHRAELGSCEDALRAIAEDLMRRLFPHAPPPGAARSQAADARIVGSAGRRPPGDPNEDNLL
jgi:predicted ATP-grasp superfamily ATP-dependent carboligase